MKSVISFLLFSLFVLLKSFSQGTTRNITVGFITGSTTICKGDTIKIKAGINCTCGFPYTSNTRAKNVGTCLADCITEDRQQVQIMGPNIISQTTPRGDGTGCGCCDSYFFDLPEAIIAPQQTSTYTVNWTKTHKRDAITCGGNNYSAETDIYNYSGSITITVLDLPPPVIVPHKEKINLGETLKLNISNCLAFHEVLVTQCKDYKLSGSCNDLPLTFKPTSIGDLSIKGRFTKASRPFCVSDWSEPIKVEVNMCGRTSFGIGGQTEQQVQEVENKVCSNNSSTDLSYHRYFLEKELCQSSRCNINEVWTLYKNNISNQAPTIGDFSVLEGNLLESMFPSPSIDGKITNGAKKSLASPEYFVGQLAAYLADNNRMTLVYENFFGKNTYDNPIAIHLDETNRCVTNYTLPGHILYPGKVTRCLVSECGLIKVKTVGEGLHFFGNNKSGKFMSDLNVLFGKELLFPNVDSRLQNRISQTFPFIALGNANSSNTISNSIHIVNKNWSISSFKVKHPNMEEKIIFQINDINNNNFWNLINVNYFFDVNGSYRSKNVANEQVSGMWKIIGIDSIEIGQKALKLLYSTPNEFALKGKFKTLNNSNLVDVDFTIEFKTQKSTGVIEDDGRNFLKIYPNPTNGTINIDSNGISIKEFSVFNSVGQLIISGDSKKNKIDISALPDGVYNILLLTEKGTYMKRILKFN